eukprot:31504-Pelagococcus_subviridis.AAC.16
MRRRTTFDLERSKNHPPLSLSLSLSLGSVCRSLRPSQLRQPWERGRRDRPRRARPWSPAASPCPWGARTRARRRCSAEAASDPGCASGGSYPPRWRCPRSTCPSRRAPPRRAAATAPASPARPPSRPPSRATARSRRPSRARTP